MHSRDNHNKELLFNAFKDIYVDIDQDSNDIMNTNSIIPDEAENTYTHRRVKEKKTCININSSQREIFTYEIVPKNEFGYYIRDGADDSLEQITPELLNNEIIISNGISRPYSYDNSGNIIKTNYKYKDPNNYVYQLPRQFSNVKSIRLLSVEVPNTLQNININNNTIFLDIIIPSFANKYLILNIDCGYYTINDVLQQIVQLINDQLTSSLFNYTYTSASGKISITSTALFHLKFRHDQNDNNNNLWYKLGFSSAYELTNTGDDKYTNELKNYTDQGLLNIMPTMNNYNYIYLSINNISNIIDIIPVNIYGKILLNKTYGKITNTFISSPKIFDEVINTLITLEIQWLDYQGQPINFQGINHSFTLEIIEYLDVLENVNYNTRRGIIDTKYYPDIIKSN